MLILQAWHGIAPSYIHKNIIQYIPEITLRSQSIPLMVVPTSRTVVYGSKHFDKLQLNFGVNYQLNQREWLV